MEGRKPREAFHRAILDRYRNVDIVFADRNNHLAVLRETLTQHFKSIFPQGKVVALDWEIGKWPKHQAIAITSARIERRGM